jgi:hypothetical protein
MTEIIDVAPGLWVWRLDHPDYRGDDDEWDGRVACTCVESGGEVALLDPLDGGDEVAARLDARPPTYVAILKPDHVRHVDAFTTRYGIPAYGPLLYWRHDVPPPTSRPIRRGSELPGGLRCLWDGRGQLETPLWLPEQRTIVFADGMTAPRGRAPDLERRRARALDAARLPGAARAAVRARDRLARRAGPRPRAFERALELPAVGR